MEATHRRREGNGWLLTLLDMMWSDYGQQMAYTLYQVPLAQLFVAYRQRCLVYGRKGVPTFGQQEDLSQNRDLYKSALEALNNG